MADVFPFKGIRFCKEKYSELGGLLCPPYDVLDDEQRQIYLKANQYNMVRLEAPGGPNRYESSAGLLDQMLSENILRQDEEESLYVYEQEFEFERQRHRLRGFFCTVKLEEFSKKIIVPHERTLQKAKQDRLQLMNATFCNFSPVYTLCELDNQTRRILKSCTEQRHTLKTTCLQGYTYRLWQVKNKVVIDEIVSSLKGKRLYIADGHHRYETALAFQRRHPSADKVMMLIADVAQPGLIILPTHRIVQTSLTNDRILNMCKKNFEVYSVSNFEEMRRRMTDMASDCAMVFGLYLGHKQWRVLRAKANTDMPDVTVLHSKILNLFFKNAALTFEKDASKCVSMVDASRPRRQICFFVNSTTTSEIIRASDSGELLPQKSTYFYPKVVAGLVINKLL